MDKDVILSSLVGSPGRGRPPVARENDALVAELRRLTGCGSARLTRNLTKLQGAGALDWIYPLSISAANRAFSKLALKPAARPNSPPGRLPGWCVAHVIPFRIADGSTCDLALLWETFSYAVFAEIRVNFGIPARLAQFVAAALKKLPLPLEERIQTILITRPIGSNAGHWTTVAGDRRVAFGRSEFLRSGRVVAFQEEGATGPLNEVSAPFATNEALVIAITTGLNAHNLESARGSHSITVQPRHVLRAWQRQGGPVFGDYFWRKGGVAWAPERRLAIALSCYDAQNRPWDGVKQIRRVLSYRSTSHNGDNSEQQG